VVGSSVENDLSSEMNSIQLTASESSCTLTCKTYSTTAWLVRQNRIIAAAKINVGRPRVVNHLSMSSMGR
jgi:hypothetical protein